MLENGKIKIELGVFGDSYADHKSPMPQKDGWMHHLSNYLNLDVQLDTVFTGESGAGNWWAYTQFKKALQSFTIKRAVFSFPSRGRLPISQNKDGYVVPNMAYMYHMFRSFNNRSIINNNNMMTYYDDKEEFPAGSNSQYEVMKMWWEVFEDEHDLVGFINDHAALSCIKLAQENNIKFTVIVPFKTEWENEYTIFDPTQYTVITGLDEISRKEMQLDNENIDYIEWHGGGGDARTNHLNSHNNTLLAGAILDGFDRTGLVDYTLMRNLDTTVTTIKNYGKVVYK